MQKFDITIVGGGLIGTTLAIALKNTPFRVALVEAFVPEFHPQAVQDMRSIALSYASKILFKKLDIWSEIEQFSTPIEKIHISEENKFSKATLDSKELNVDIFGHVIPIPLLYQTLQNHLSNIPNLTLIRPAKSTQLNYDENNTSWNLTLENHSSPIQTKLVIAADGENSFIRQYLNLPVSKIDYQETALVSTAKISEPHYNTAYERFTKKGVLAVMPRENQHAAIIWTTNTANSEQLKNDFLSKTQLSMGYKCGKFSELSTIQTYPLKFLHAEKQTQPGLILLGNAAHVLHPVAAQGLNLGLRDVSTLLELLSQEADVENPMLYRAYEKKRENDQRASENFSRDLIKIFGSKNPVISALRSAGLGTFDLIPTAKRMFCLRRMGVF
jgi:2-octaprenyl-6-methoxyphenol hydroxylase